GGDPLVGAGDGQDLAGRRRVGVVTADVHYLGVDRGLGAGVVAGAVEREGDRGAGAGGRTRQRRLVLVGVADVARGRILGRGDLRRVLADRDRLVAALGRGVPARRSSDLGGDPLVGAGDGQDLAGRRRVGVVTADVH